MRLWMIIPNLSPDFSVHCSPNRALNLLVHLNGHECLDECVSRYLNKSSENFEAYFKIKNKILLQNILMCCNQICCFQAMLHYCFICLVIEKTIYFQWSQLKKNYFLKSNSPLYINEGTWWRSFVLEHILCLQFCMADPLLALEMVAKYTIWLTFRL